jgi:hypothetical protein
MLEHHLGDAPDVNTAVRMARKAVDTELPVFDNCWEYRRGKTDDWMGAGRKGRHIEPLETLNTSVTGAPWHRRLPFLYVSSGLDA